MRLVRSEPPASIDGPQLPLAKRPDFDLGGTRVFPSRLLLDGPSATVPLERRVMEVLLTFVDADGAVLSRDELLNRCWPGVVVGDDAVHRVIGGLRKAAAASGRCLRHRDDSAHRLSAQIKSEPGNRTCA